MIYNGLVRSVASLVLVCACNQVFGVDHTTRVPGVGGIDAQYFDAPADAPFACPALGVVPQFKRGLRQIDADGCVQYTRSDTLATALCTGIVMQGPVDGPLTAIPDLGLCSLSAGTPVLSPEGDQLYISAYDWATYTSQPFRVYDRQGDGSWQRGADLPMAPTSSISTVTRGPDRHILYWQYGAAGANIEEWANGTGTWKQVAVHGAAEHGLAAIFFVWLGSDGLRAIIQGDVRGSSTPQLFYTDRAAVGAAFNMAVPMTGVPLVNDAFMTDDCGRIYMSGLSSIFYEQQL